MDSKVIAELEDIRIRGKGVINPHALVERAKPKNNPLHSYFEWDNKIAGHNYRLWQARKMISVIVTSAPTTDEEIRAYVSLPTDRNIQGGYRAIIDVLSDDTWRQALLEQAFKDFQIFKQRYDQLVELAPIFEAYETVKIS